MLTSAYPAGLFGDPEAPWGLVLSGGARKLVGGFIVPNTALALLAAVVRLTLRGSVRRRLRWHTVQVRHIRLSLPGPGRFSWGPRAPVLW